MCLGFTARPVAWADSDHDAHVASAGADLYVEDPYAPHDTSGSTARLGTSVGFVYSQPDPVLALGLTAAVGHRFGRLALEAEYTTLMFRANGAYMSSIGPVDGDVSVGRGQRAALLARVEVVRLGSHVVGQNSMVALYVEGGVGTAWNHWDQPTGDQARVVPDDSRRVEGQAGFGLLIDHRLQEPIGFPHRVGWFLGWRLAMSPHQAMTGSVCRGVSCRSVTMTDDHSYVDRSMLFQSSLSFTF